MALSDLVFRKRWLAGNQGFGINWIKQITLLEDDSFTFDLNDMTVEQPPIEAWVGMTLQGVFERVRQTLAGKPSAFASEAEITQVHQLLNRSDGVVPLVLIKGYKVWAGAQFGPAFGKQHFWSVLKPESS